MYDICPEWMAIHNPPSVNSIYSNHWFVRFILSTICWPVLFMSLKGISVDPRIQEPKMYWPSVRVHFFFVHTLVARALLNPWFRSSFLLINMCFYARMYWTGSPCMLILPLLSITREFAFIFDPIKWITQAKVIWHMFHCFYLFIFLDIFFHLRLVFNFRD